MLAVFKGDGLARRGGGATLYRGINGKNIRLQGGVCFR